MALKDLVERGLWDNKMRNQIMLTSGTPFPFSNLFLACLTLPLGSIQNIAQIPNEVKAVYKTVWQDLLEEGFGHGCRPWSIYLSESESECAFGGADTEAIGEFHSLFYSFFVNTWTHGQL